MKTTFSIITAVYNRGDSIASALDSVLSQNYAHIELIVIDGASSDGTREVLERYRDRISVLVSEPDQGIYDALNKGIALATGDVIGFLHADDMFASPESIAWVAEAFSDPLVDAVYGDLQYVRAGDPGRVVRHWRAGSFSRSTLAMGWMPPHPALYVRRACYARLGGFDTSYRIAADYDFMLRLLTSDDLRVAYIPRLLVKMRLGGASNRSLANLYIKSMEDLRALRKNKVGGWGALFCKNVSKLPQFIDAVWLNRKTCRAEE